MSVPPEHPLRDCRPLVDVHRALGGFDPPGDVAHLENPTRQALASPGKSIRTRISSVDGSVDVQISLEDRDAIVDHVVVGMKHRRGRKTETIRFVIQGGLPRPRR